MDRKTQAAPKFCPGTVVRSLAGRDAGRWFVVLQLQDGYAHIADGDLHPLQHAKRKKLRHLAPSNTVWNLTPPTPWTDAALRGALARFGEPPAGKGGQDLV